MQPSPPFSSEDVAAVFDSYPADARASLLTLRALIFDTAASDPRIGRIEETLKWGQPSYLTPETKSGSTIRLAVPKTGGFGLYTHCQTTIMSDFQKISGQEFTFDGNRGVVFTPGQIPDPDTLRLLIHAALTYHLKPES